MGSLSNHTPLDATDYAIGLLLLRVQIKALVAKVGFLRFEEGRRSAAACEILRNNRRTHMRDNIRSAQLAAAYLKGRGYREVESRVGLGRPGPNWELVRDYVMTYGPAKVRTAKSLRVLDDIRAWAAFDAKDEVVLVLDAA